MYTPMETSMDSEDQNETSKSVPIRLGDCEVCGTPQAKYTCPRCEVKTCCIPCVNIHKKELECDGVRNKVLFKRLSKFSNLDLLSDYRLLEDVTRTVQKIRVDPCKFVSRFLPKHLFGLKKAADRRGMRLHFLPRNFKRAEENTSRFDMPTQTIKWKIKWHFPQADVCLFSESVPETMQLVQALSPLLEPDLSMDKDLKEKMQFYYSAGSSGVCALLRVGEMEKNRYHVLDLHTTIRGNLIRKSIIEFPVIVVVLKDHKYAFDLYDSDEEVDNWKGNWEMNSQKEGKPDCQSPPNRKHKSSSESQNLLLATDASSEED